MFGVCKQQLANCLRFQLYKWKIDGFLRFLGHPVAKNFRDPQKAIPGPRRTDLKKSGQNSIPTWSYAWRWQTYIQTDIHTYIHTESYPTSSLGRYQSAPRSRSVELRSIFAPSLRFNNPQNGGFPHFHPQSQFKSIRRFLRELHFGITHRQTRQKWGISLVRIMKALRRIGHRDEYTIV